MLWREIRTAVRLLLIGMVCGLCYTRLGVTLGLMVSPFEQVSMMPFHHLIKLMGDVVMVLVVLCVVWTLIWGSISLFIYTVPHRLMGTPKIRQQLTETAVERITKMPLSNFIDDRFIMIVGAADATFGRTMSERCGWLRLWMWRLSALFYDRSRQTVFPYLFPLSNQQLIPLI